MQFQIKTPPCNTFGSLLLLCVFFAACGGSNKKVVTPAEPLQEEEEEEEELIPEEKFEEINRTFQRKASFVAHCFPLAVEAGELRDNDRVKVSVGLVIQPDGSAREIKIIGASKRSAVMESCIKSIVTRWEFTTLPKPLQYSYGFILQRF